MKFSVLLFFCAISVFAAPPEISILETNVLLIRVENLTPDFSAQLQKIPSPEKISGIVLDLRFADGSGEIESSAKFFADEKTPLLILVNGRTRGAAAQLAEALRAEKKCLIIGSTNEPGKILPDLAVNASAADEKNFQENSFAIPAADKSARIILTDDFLPFIDHTSEAELVRQRVKDGEQDDSKTPRPAAPRVIRDPALARALDLLKALAIFPPAQK